RGERPEDVQTGLYRGRRRRGLDPARAADLIRQPDEPPRGQHRGDRPPGRTRHHPHHRDRLPPRTTARHHHRRRNHGPSLHRNLAPLTVPAPPRTCTSQPPNSHYLTRTSSPGRQASSHSGRPPRNATHSPATTSSDPRPADFVLCGGPRSWRPAHGRSAGYACPAWDGYWVLAGEWGLQERFQRGNVQRHTNIIRGTGVRRTGPGLPSWPAAPARNVR